MTSNASTRATIFLYDAEPTRRVTVLAYVCFDHVQLRYNVALKFDATFNVIVFPLDVGKRFARLIARALKRGTPLRRRLGVNQAPHGCPRLKKGHGFRG